MIHEQRRRALSINCIEEGKKYTLRLDGAGWWEIYPSIEEAVLRAPRLIESETRLTVYDQAGSPTVIATVYPNTHG